MRPMRLTAKSSAVCYGGQSACEICHKPETRVVQGQIVAAAVNRHLRCLVGLLQ